ncbi:MAG: YlxR family protein [bacterium]|nr:YlxR family protein [bacterium]
MSKGKVSRKCVGCGLIREKIELSRFTRNCCGTVVEDVFRKMNGRGAYVCKATKEHCLIKAISKRSFDRALPLFKQNAQVKTGIYTG